MDLTGQTFTLAVGRPVQFPLFSTTSDRIDRPGDVVSTDDEFRPLPPIHTLFKSAAAKTASVPVHLRATLTELGTLELWCVSNAADERWRLEFELRRSVAEGHAMQTVTESMPAHFAEARAVVDRVFGKQPQAVDLREVRQLARTLEKTIGVRETWRLPLLRELWAGLIAGAKHRRRSADHERIFLQLVGYTLRPGFGYPLDDWRCEQTFKLFPESVKFHKRAAHLERVLDFVAADFRRSRRSAADRSLGLCQAFFGPAHSSESAEVSGKTNGHSARGFGRNGAHGRFAGALGTRAKEPSGRVDHRAA